MRELIKGQTIRVDNHRSGTREPVEWGKGVHLDKAINDKKHKSVRVKIYLDSDRGIEFISRGDDDVRQRIVSEISDVLAQNPQKRKAFVEDVIKEIDRFSQNLSPAERRKNLEEGANRIANHFNLGTSFVEIIDQHLNQCLTGHFDEKNKVCLILQDLREKSIKVSEDLDALYDEDLFSE